MGESRDVEEGLVGGVQARPPCGQISERGGGAMGEERGEGREKERQSQGWEFVPHGAIVAGEGRRGKRKMR
jgi:hypothetical protein